MRFKAVLQANGKTATGIEVPPEVMAELGGGKRPLIKVTINEHTYPSAIGIMGGKSLIPVSADNRAKAGIAAGDLLDVTIELDTGKREIAVPDDLRRALATNDVAQRAFEALSNSRKKRHVLSIEAAKTDETRQRRISKTLEELTR